MAKDSVVELRAPEAIEDPRGVYSKPSLRTVYAWETSWRGGAEMDAATKLARQRLSVLELAEILGNVSEACRRRGISRSQF